MSVLGIETSCDETAIALLSNEGRVLSNLVYSQIWAHKEFGGVVPEVAARLHSTQLPLLLQKILQKETESITHVVSTVGPGLIGSLATGTSFARGIALARHIPWMGVNHIEAHLLMPLYTQPSIQFPFLGLILSGGHTLLVLCRALGNYTILGQTLDDSVGETFDKVAQLLGLSYPGGPELEKIVFNGQLIPFKAPLVGKGLNFSFSGLKSAMARYIHTSENTAQRNADIAFSLHQATITIINDKLKRAITLYKKDLGPNPRIVAGGGVMANTIIRTALTKFAKAEKCRVYYPPIRFCTDNALMIAWVGMQYINTHCTHPWTTVQPRLPLGKIAV